ncbi:MAG: hypothetical protein R6T98_06610 [Desulfatiglandales bacterium]
MNRIFFPSSNRMSATPPETETTDPAPMKRPTREPRPPTRRELKKSPSPLDQ